MPEVRELETAESHRAALALLELRPHIASADELVAQVDAQRALGYRLAASFEGGEGAHTKVVRSNPQAALLFDAWGSGHVAALTAGCGLGRFTMASARAGNPCPRTSIRSGRWL